MEKVRLELTPLGLETQCADRYTTPPFFAALSRNRTDIALLCLELREQITRWRGGQPVYEIVDVWATSCPARLGNLGWEFLQFELFLSCAADVVTHPRFELGTYRLKADYSASWVNGWFGGVAASQHWKELPTCVGGGGLGIRTRGDQPHSTPLLRFPTRLILHAYYGFYKSYTIFLLRCLKRHNVGQEPRNFRLFFLSY